jgi:hypothetical protein
LNPWTRRPVPRARSLATDDLQRLRGRRRLGDASRRALADPQHPPADRDLDPELLLVIGPDGLEQPVDGPVPGRSLGVLLEPALGALEARQRHVLGQLGLGPGLDPVTGERPAEVEVDRAHQRLEGGREQRRPDPAAAHCLALAEQQERAEVQACRETREPGGAHDRGAPG